MIDDEQAAKAPATPTEATATVTSRMPTSQKALIEAAAAQREWSASTLMRVAGYERAVHILNTSRETTFDFREVARALADQLCRPRMRFTSALSGELYSAEDLKTEVDYTYSVIEGGSDYLLLADTDGIEVGDQVRCTPSQIDADRLASFTDAVRLGGTDFIEMLLEACAYQVRPESAHDPIEPNAE